jgi:hypothetical protein
MIFAPLMVQAVQYYSAWEKQLAHHRGDAVLALYRRDHQLYLSPLLIENEEYVIFPLRRWDIFFVLYDGEYPSIRGRHVPTELMQFKFDGVHLHELKPIPLRAEPFTTNHIQSAEDFCEDNCLFPTKRVTLGPKDGIVCFASRRDQVGALVYGPRDLVLQSTNGIPSCMDLKTFVEKFGLPCFVEAKYIGPPRKKHQK